MNVRTIATMAAVTAVTIFAANQLSAKPGIFRTIFKGPSANGNGS